VADKIVFRGVDATASTTASNAGTKLVFVPPRTPDPGLHPPEREFITAAPTHQRPVWLSPDSAGHMLLPINSVILASSALLIVAWHVARSRNSESAALVR
jgi:hypothetical protein